jgi:MbtH protein
MSSLFGEESDEYSVLVNDEGQYSLWRSSREVPLGWRAVARVGSRAKAIEYVEMHWVDMRPKSVVERIQSTAALNGAPLDKEQGS